MKELIDNYNNIFENIKHIDEYENEYWEARELQKVLEYKEWRKFEGVINKARIACDNSGIDTSLQFVQAGKMSILSNGGTMPEDLPTPYKSLKEIDNIDLLK